MTATYQAHGLRKATHKLEHGFRLRVLDGLKRKAILRCSDWTKLYRVMGNPTPGPWSFKYHPWAKAMHDSDAHHNVGQKGAQLAYTETMINRAFFCLDVKGLNVLYLLPNQTPDAKDFSTSRFDPALEMSPHLQNMFSDVKNIGLKRAGNVSLFIRGTRSRAGIKSIPVALLIADERDEMQQAQVTLAQERLAGQQDYQFWEISTPRIPGEGINRTYLTSSQEHFCFKCPGCNRYTELLFPDCLEIGGERINSPEVLENSFLKCKECSKKLGHHDKWEWLSSGIWVPMNEGVSTRGFHVNQLYSSAPGAAPGIIANKYIKAQQDPTDAQEFWNNQLGVPYIVDGARITDSHIQACIGEHTTRQYDPNLGILEKKKVAFGTRPVTLGIDVGSKLHYVLKEWTFEFGHSEDLNAQAYARNIGFGTLDHFEQLDQLMNAYKVTSAVIDANPERRKATEFARRFPNRVWICIYSRGINGREVAKPQEAEYTVLVDRTSWLDQTLGRYKNGTISLPQDLSLEFKQHIKCLVRVYTRDKEGNPVGQYVKGTDPDHFAHADNYGEIALRFIGAASATQDIKTSPW